jgi:hypothetical protein
MVSAKREGQRLMLLFQGAHHTLELAGFDDSKFERYVTKFAPNKTLSLIA